MWNRDSVTGFRKLGTTLLVLAVAAVFCVGISATALAQDASADTAHEEPVSDTEGQPENVSETPTDFHPEDGTDGSEEESTEEEAHQETDQTEDEECVEHEAEESTSAAADDEEADEDEDCESEDDSDEECEVLGQTDGSDDRADDDEDDVCPPEETDDGGEADDETEVLGTAKRRPALAATGSELIAAFAFALALLVGGATVRMGPAAARRRESE